MKRPVTAFALLLAAATVACLDNDITGTRPLSFSLTSDVTSAAVGDSITFSFSATGTSIFGVLLFYGDGVIDTLATESPNTVEWARTIKRVYEVPGDFDVVGRLETAAGSRTDTVAVVIAPEGG